MAISTIAFDVVVVDEAQNFSDGARGMILQECLEQVLDRNSKTHLVMLAPGAEGFHDRREAAPPDNDPFYPDSDMECVGQLRFGASGEGAARTLTLVLPCTELVRDDRTDDTVDIAVGTGFRDVNPPRAVATPWTRSGPAAAPTARPTRTRPIPRPRAPRRRGWTRRCWRRPATPPADRDPLS